MRTLGFITAILIALAIPIAIAHSQARLSGTNVPLLDGAVNLGPLPGESGVWEIDYNENMADFIPAGRGNRDVRSVRRIRGSAAEPQVPFMPWSAAVYDYNVGNFAKYDPESYCDPPGGPRLFTAPYPMEIVQIPGQKRIFFLFEVSHLWREVYLDGREHPVTATGTWLGHSVGRYEDGGRTLRIDVANFNEGTWLDFAGHPHTNLLQVVEKFTRPTRNQLHYEAMIDDPGAYTRPWTVAWDMKWWPKGQLDEYICTENNRYIRDLKDDFGNLMFFAK
jgi:hypothetical protein